MIIDGTGFWQRYKGFRAAAKDLSVSVATHIPQSTLSTWRKKKALPDTASVLAIAKKLNTTVEYLVNGEKDSDSKYSPRALEIAGKADKMSEKGLDMLSEMAEKIKNLSPKEDKED